MGDLLEFDEDKYVALLAKLIDEAKFLQNNPPDLVPVEDRAGRHVLAVLEPYSVENGGPLHIKHVSFTEGRGNILVEYKGEGDGIMSFVGCHLDVVTANPETWTFDPFKLTRDGDKLRGRGTTDCLGHVALLTAIFEQLAIKKPKLKRTVVGVWIANEENSKVLGLGVDELVKQGYMKHLLPGPLYWVDTADSQPCIGTGGIVAWSLTGHGRLFHSGLPHKSINPLELVMEALNVMQKRFYEDFPAHAEEAKYGFATPSTMKPTQWNYPGGSINQIPGQATVCGDCRITPFYEIEDVMAALHRYVDDINADINALPTRGPCSKYELPEEGLKGRVELKFFDSHSKGIACKLDTEGYHTMINAFNDVFGTCKPFAITGSLPCIRELQDEGYDVQALLCDNTTMFIMGSGSWCVDAWLIADDEYALLSDMANGFKVLNRLIVRFNE